MPNKTIPYEPTPDEKLAALGAVFYEMLQYRNCVVMLRAFPDQAIQNALLESMLIHVRALVDFFECTRRGQDRSGKEFDDVLSSDFGFPPSAVRLPADYGSRINKEVAHLTYARAKRLTRKDKEWDPAAFLPVIVRSLDFIDSRTKEELSRLEEFRKANAMDPLSVPVLKDGLSRLRFEFELVEQQRSASTGTVDTNGGHSGPA